MRISDWSSDVCSSDLISLILDSINVSSAPKDRYLLLIGRADCLVPVGCGQSLVPCLGESQAYKLGVGDKPRVEGLPLFLGGRQDGAHDRAALLDDVVGLGLVLGLRLGRQRSEAHKSELQSLIRIS